jgi:CDP-diacylglycerol--glycerol-3-phosphate 3-phosphatidyltransferase
MNKHKNIAKMAKQIRDSIQQFVYKIIDPSVRLMAHIGITPNVITTIGLIGNIVAASLFVYSALYVPADDYTIVGIAGVLIIFASLFDMVDGYLARKAGLATTFGAFYDSVLDRYCELFTISGICYYFMAHGYHVFALFTFLSLVGSVMVSYVRARAEGLNVDCKVGLMQRPERVVLTSIGAILCGILADNVSDCFSPMWILFIPQALIALLANWTAFVRIFHVYQKLNGSDNGSGEN